MRASLILTVSALTLLLGACSYDRSPEGNYDPENTGYDYAPEGDMYYSEAYDPLSQSIYNFNPYNPDSMTMREPAKGTIARGNVMYYFPYQNTTDDYLRAGRELRNPIPADTVSLAKGQHYFVNYCWQCHGKEGKNDGPLFASGKFPKPSWPAYASDYVRDLRDGQIYFSITYGKNLMGPHGTLLSPQERWHVVNYIRHLQGQGSAQGADDKESTPQGADSSAAPASGAEVSTATTTQPTKKG